LKVRTRDAVIVVPGIMGSELVDTLTNEKLWGSSDPHWYVDAWTTGRPLRKLNLTPDEDGGKYERVHATRLLRSPSFAPILRGFDPYTKIMNKIKNVVAHPHALREFPYDWRLPVEHNTQLLAEVCRRHLQDWSRHPAQLTAMQDDPDRSPPQLVIVAHSMGGLVATGLASIDYDLATVRQIITLGTPFYGAVSAALLINSGVGGPRLFPRTQLSVLARGLPGVYDLLPTYRCVDVGSTAEKLSPSSVARIGGSSALAQAAADRRKNRIGLSPIDLVQIVGVRQRTPQSLVITDGMARGEEYTCKPTRDNQLERTDVGGDGVVSRESSELAGTSAGMPIAQSHGALAKAIEATIVVTDVLLREETGPWQGRATIGLYAPDLVTPGEHFNVEIAGVQNPRGVSCRVSTADYSRPFLRPEVRARTGRIYASVRLPSVGLYRIEVDGGGASAVSQLVLAVEQPRIAG